MRRRWSLLWWLPAAVFALGAAMVPTGPPLAAGSFSDHLVLLRPVLVGAAYLYFYLFVFVRICWWAFSIPRREDPRRGFDVVLRKAPVATPGPAGADAGVRQAATETTGL